MNNHNHNSEHSHHDHHQAMMMDFKRRFLVSLLLSLPIFILSPMIQNWLRIELIFPGSSFVLLFLSSLVFFYGGLPFFKGFISEIRAKNPGMMTLVALAITVSYLYSLATVLGLEGEDFFWELASLIDIMLIGHYLEMKATISAGDALAGLKKLLPDSASVLVDGQTIDTPISALEEGDYVLVRPGEKIPADGIIIKGKGHVDESFITGEAIPILKKEGDRLIGGSISEDGSLELKIEALGEDAYLSKVISLVNAAQASRSKTQNLADRSAFYLTLLAIASGLISFISWYYLKRDLSFALTRMATVMVIACPHALGLAMPLVVARFMGEGAKNGLLIKNKTAFEKAGKIDLVVFDKTGTLTEGSFGVKDINLYADLNKEEALILAGSLENHSEHPLARAIMDEVRKNGLEIFELEGFEVLKGQGIRAEIDNREILMVGPGYLKKEGIDIPSEGETELATRIYLLKERVLLASFNLVDKLREDSKIAVKELKNRGIKVWMLTGDNEASAKYVAGELGLDGYESQVLPHEKEIRIKDFQERYHVAMTGDGINDAPALARADLGIAIGSGTDIAAATADIILVNSNPRDVVSLIGFGRSSYRKMLENLFWATGYNLVAIPIAAGIFYNFGINISPALGALLMSLSTIIVAINAKLLRFR